MKLFVLASAGCAVAFGLLATASPAVAGGCNGVVNQLVWGCAAWDNNNGPQYPNWKGAPPSVQTPQVVSRPSLASYAVLRPTAYVQGRAVVKLDGVWTYLVTQGGGNYVPAGPVPASIVAAGGLN